MTKVISKINIISPHQYKLINNIITQHNYENNYKLIKRTKTIHEQILIKIISLIFNNSLETYPIYDNIIKDIKEITVSYDLKIILIF